MERASISKYVRSMDKRFSLLTVDPAAYQAMSSLEGYLKNSGLEAQHRELIKIRASQINGCAYCVDMHVAEALERGENPRRLHVVSLWREVDWFDEKERAILALTEELTLIQNRVKDETYKTAVEVLGERYTAAVLMAALTINAWNRIGVGLEMSPKA